MRRRALKVIPTFTGRKPQAKESAGSRRFGWRLARRTDAVARKEKTIVFLTDTAMMVAENRLTDRMSASFRFNLF